MRYASFRCRKCDRARRIVELDWRVVYCRDDSSIAANVVDHCKFACRECRSKCRRLASAGDGRHNWRQDATRSYSEGLNDTLRDSVVRAGKMSGEGIAIEQVKLRTIAHFDEHQEWITMYS